MYIKYIGQKIVRIGYSWKEETYRQGQGIYLFHCKISEMFKNSQIEEYITVCVMVSYKFKYISYKFK